MKRYGQLPISITPIDDKKKRGLSRYRLFPLPPRIIHVIPVVVLFCLFILWLVSRPAKIRDGKVVPFHDVDVPPPPVRPNNSQIELAFLATATSPTASVPINLKDGGTAAVHDVDMPLPLPLRPNNSQIEVAILASVTSPIATVVMNLTGNRTESDSN